MPLSPQRSLGKLFFPSLIVFTLITVICRTTTPNTPLDWSRLSLSPMMSIGGGRHQNRRMPIQVKIFGMNWKSSPEGRWSQKIRQSWWRVSKDSGWLLMPQVPEIYPTFEKSDSSNLWTEWQCNWLLIYIIVVLLYSLSRHTPLLLHIYLCIRALQRDAASCSWYWEKTVYYSGIWTMLRCGFMIDRKKHNGSVWGGDQECVNTPSHFIQLR